MNVRDERIHSLQAFRAVAVILVVFNHATVFGREVLGFSEFTADDPLGLSSLANVLFFGNPQANIRVDIFFVISGFMIFYAYEKYIGNRGKLGSYIVRRLIRIYPLLWIFTLTKIALLLVNPARAKSYEMSPATMIASLLALPQDNLPLVAAAWTLPFEMLFYVLFGLAIYLGARRAAMLAGLWALAIIVANVGPALLDPASASRPLQGGFLLYERNAEFLLGCIAAYAVRHLTIERPGLLIALGSLGLTFSCVLIGRGVAVPSYTLLVGLPAVLLIAGTVSLELQRQTRVPRFLALIGDASYSIFLSHSTFINLFLLVAALGGLRIVDPLPIMLSMTVVATLGGIAVYYLVERPMLTYLRRRLLEPRQRTGDAHHAQSQADGLSATAG